MNIEERRILYFDDRVLPPFDVDMLVVFNAPRPLYSAMSDSSPHNGQWRADFIKGIFYAAVDPEHELASWAVRENVRLDACIVRPISEEETKAEAIAYMKGYDPGVSDFLCEKYWQEYWTTKLWRRTIEIDERGQFVRAVDVEP